MISAETFWMDISQKRVHLSRTLGLRDMVLVLGEGTAGVASIRRCQKFPPCSIDPAPTISKMDMPLAKAEPTSDINSTSVIAAGREELGLERGVRI